MKRKAHGYGYTGREKRGPSNAPGLDASVALVNPWSRLALGVVCQALMDVVDRGADPVTRLDAAFWLELYGDDYLALGGLETVNCHGLLQRTADRKRRISRYVTEYDSLTS